MLLALNSVLLTVAQSSSANIPVIPFLGTIVGTIVGGGIGFLSGVGADWFKRMHTRPIININEDTTEVNFDLRTYHEPEGHVPRSPHRTKYTGTRIKVENNGRSAAEDCKASLVTKETEIRVGWMIPKQDCTVTINADDAEYLDLFAIREDGTDLVFTTDRGYGEYVDTSRRFDVRVIDAKLKVSAKNAKQCVKSIRIINLRDTQNKVVRLADKPIN